MRNGYILDVLTSADIQKFVILEERWLKFIKVLFIERVLKHNHLAIL